MTQTTMQAIQVYQYGGPEELRLETIPRPEPQSGEVLVQINAIGVLPADWKMRRGDFKAYRDATFPYVPGSAIAGIVEAVGPDVTAFKVGDAVFGRSNHGAYAEYTTTAVETLAHKPERISFAEAATISGGATTAWNALFENADVQAGQRVLIHGAAGGVGLFAVQLAHWKGAHVIGTASSSNQAFLHNIGAEMAIDYTSTDFETVVSNMDVVIDPIGGDVQQRSMSVLKRGGLLVSLLGLPSQDLAQQYGIRAITNEVTFPFPSTQMLQTIATLMDEGTIKAVIETEYALADTKLAHEHSQTGHGRGRIILRP